MFKRIIFAVAIVFCFVLLLAFLNQNFTLLVNRFDDFKEFRQAEIKGTVTYFDEGRGLKVRVNNQNKTYAFATGSLVYSNKPALGSVCRLRDSLIKHRDTDTFTIKRRSEVFVYVLPNEK